MTTNGMPQSRLEELRVMHADCLSMNSQHILELITEVDRLQQLDLIGLEEVTIKEMERRMILAAFNRYGGDRRKMWESLGIGERTLCGKLRLLGIGPREKPRSAREAAGTT